VKRSAGDEDGTAETVAPAAVADTVVPANAPTAPPPATALAETVAPNAFGLTAVDSREIPVNALALTIVDRAHYDILDEFGRGGLGRVLRARDRRSGRIVAIKEALRSSPSLLARFAREALVTANLQHPSIVPVYEVGMWGNGEPFYAMKLVAGRSLADAVRKAASLRDRLALLPHLIAVADALAYAHGQRVIHRDLKPANVLLGDYGETVVIDWGLAKKLDDRDPDDDRDASATGFGAVMGTPGYMSPEQARGEDVDEQTDVFAIGAMLYEVLSQTRPYSDTNEISAVIDKSGSESPKPLTELMPEAPAELVAIVERAMAFDAKNRYPSAKELAEDLRRFETGQLVGAHQYTTWQLVRRWFRRHAAIVSAIAIALVVLAIVGAYSVARVRHERDAALVAERRAAAEKALAEDRAAALAEEQGRQLAMTGDAARALPYLQAAVEAGRKSPALMFVLQRALDAVAPIEAVLVASQGPTHTVSYSPDGSRLIAASSDNNLRIWDTHAHKLVATIGHGLSAVWSPDGQYIAAVTDDAINFLAPDGKPLASAKVGVVSSWLVPSPSSKLVGFGTTDGHVVVAQPDGKLVLDTKAHDAEVGEVEWSPNGEVLAAAADDGVVTLWHLPEAVRVGLLDHSEKVISVSFSPDGHRIATADAGGNVVSWDLATGKKLVELKGHTNSVEAVDFDPTGKYLVTVSTDRTAGIWDSMSGKRLTTMQLGFSGNNVRFAPDGRRVITSTTHGDLQVWNLDGDPLLTLAGHAATISMFQFSPDGKQLASCGHDGDVRLWRLDSAPSVVPVDNKGTRSWRGEWAPDGSTFATTSSDGVLRIYDGKTAALVRELKGHTGEILRLAYSPDGQSIATASADGTVRIWQGDKSRVIDAKAGRVRYVEFSHEGRHLATTHDDGTARVWYVSTLTELVTLTPSRGKPRSAVWSPDDKKLVTPLDADGASLWDVKTGTLLGEAKLAGQFTPAAKWLADGSAFVLAGGSNLAAKFGGDKATLLTTFTGHVTGPITAVDRGPDDVLITAGYDGVARLWKDGTQMRLFGDGTYPMTSAEWAPRGNLVVTSDISARVWDVTGGELVGILTTAHDVENSAVSETRWSPDGTRLLVLSLGLAPRLWRVPQWSGTLDALKQRLACTERWKLSSSQLVLTTPDAAQCR
jgi:WD40 repeat protein/tRNA A-37 threonylcarbamoyl transferase component Bud32